MVRVVLGLTVGVLLLLPVRPVPVRADILLDRIVLRNGTAVLGKILAESDRTVTIFSTRMEEQTLRQSEIRFFEKVVTAGNPFRVQEDRPFSVSLVTTVTMRDGKEFRGISLDRQGDSIWLLSPEAYLLQIPLQSVAQVVQEPLERVVWGPGDVSKAPPSLGLAPKSPLRSGQMEGVAPSAGRYGAGASGVSDLSVPAHAVRADAAGGEGARFSPGFHGAVYLGLHEPGSGLLDQFYGGGVSFGAAAEYMFKEWVGGRVGFQYFSKTVSGPDGRKWILNRIPMDAAAVVEPFPLLMKFTPYFGAGGGATFIKQQPDFVVFTVSETQEEKTTSRYALQYQAFAGGRMPVWQKLNAVVELRYSSAPFVSEFYNLNAGGIDFLLGVRW